MKLLIINKKAISLLAVFLLLFTFCIVNIIMGDQEQAQASIPYNETVRLPVLMYHSVCNRNDIKSEYILPVQTFREDMQYLKENGYTSIFASELINYVYNEGNLPAKPVMITFDDGYLNNLTNVLPVLEEYNMKAVISVVGLFTEKFSSTNDRNELYSHLTWEDIIALKNSGLVEIGNHTYDMHNLSPRKGCLRLKNETKDAYINVLKEDVGRLQTLLGEKVGLTPTVFAYPYGAISEDSVDVLHDLGFKTLLTCYEKMNYITKDPECLDCIYRYNRKSGISTKAFMNKIE